MKNRFEKYNLFKGELNLKTESFELFKSLFDNNYGLIEEDDNLISIHTGGWSDNEDLINEFKETIWWRSNHKITEKGGHYFFDTDTHKDKKWKIIKFE